MGRDRAIGASSLKQSRLNLSKEREIERSWHANAAAWTAVVREQRIESRKLGTDRAILQAVLQGDPRSVLDVGCGEGWLARALAAQGVEVTGFDVSEDLVQSARAEGGGNFVPLSYEDFIANPAQLGTDFDAAVANFSILGEEIGALLGACGSVLSQRARLVIQTVHPFTACGADQKYRDGWRVESFNAFGEDFRAEMPWYYRTMSSWLTELARAGFQIESLVEPLHPESGRPLSLVLVCRFYRTRTVHGS